MKRNQVNTLVQCMTFSVFFWAPVVGAQEKSGGPEKIGKVHFPVSCSAEVQTQFDRAVAIVYPLALNEAVTVLPADKIITLCSQADTERAELTEAKAFLAKPSL
jgi:hypothetical protein